LEVVTGQTNDVKRKNSGT